MSKIKTKLLNLAINTYIQLSQFKSKDKRPEKPKDRPLNILVISNTALGDTILSTPALKALRSCHPESHIYLLVDYYLFNLFQGFEYVSAVIPYKKNLFYLIKLIINFRKLKIDTVCILHANGPEDLFISFLSGAKAITKSTRNEHHLFHQYFQNTPKKTTIHEVDLRIGSIMPVIDEAGDKTLSLPSRYYEYPGKFLDTGDKITIGFQLGASYQYRMWPLECFEKLGIELLSAFDDILIVLTGSRAEALMAKTLEAKLGDNTINMCGKTSVENLPYLIKELDLLVTNDTGTLHMAIALKTRTVSLFGASRPEIIGPYQDPDLHTVISKECGVFLKTSRKQRTDELMRRITVKEVFEAINKQIQAIKSNEH